MLDYGIATRETHEEQHCVIVYSPFIEGIFFKDNKNHIVALFSHFGFFVFSVCSLSTYKSSLTIDASESLVIQIELNSSSKHPKREKTAV